MRARSALLVPVLGLLLAGCSDEPAAMPPPPPPSSAAATAEPLEVPASATPATPEGAANFARYYLEVLNRAFESGDVTVLDAISHPECTGCNNLIQAAREGRSGGKTFEGGAFTVREAEATETAPGDALVDAVFDRAASRVRNPDGTTVDAPATTGTLLQLRCLREGDSWVARGLRFPEVPQ